MATYVVGDVQGCYQTFRKLITKLQFNPQKDHLIFAGDLIARGADSLAVTQWVLEHRDSCSAVLGNHEDPMACTKVGKIHVRGCPSLLPCL